MSCLPLLCTTPLFQGMGTEMFRVDFVFVDLSSEFFNMVVVVLHFICVLRTCVRGGWIRMLVLVLRLTAVLVF